MPNIKITNPLKKFISSFAFLANSSLLKFCVWSHFFISWKKYQQKNYRKLVDKLCDVRQSDLILASVIKVIIIDVVLCMIVTVICLIKCSYLNILKALWGCLSAGSVCGNERQPYSGSTCILHIAQGKTWRGSRILRNERKIFMF